MDLEYELLNATETGDAVMVASLIKKGVDVCTLLEMPLLQAARNGHMEVKLLVAAGSLGLKTHYDPAVFAAANLHPEIANYIRQAHRELGWNVNGRGRFIPSVL